MKLLLESGGKIFTACNLKGLDTCDGVYLDIWIIPLFGLLESILETTLISHCSGFCQCPAHTLGSHLWKPLPVMAVSLPEGFYLAVGTYCTHIGKTEILESNALETLLHDNQKSVDTYSSFLLTSLVGWLRGTCPTWLPRAPQWDCVLVGHNVLDNTPCTDCPLSHLTSSLPYWCFLGRPSNTTLVFWVLVSKSASERLKIKPFHVS